MIVNVLPHQVKGDEDNLLNIPVETLELNNINPEEAIPKITRLIPELNRRYLKLLRLGGVVPGGVVSQVVSAEPPSRYFSLNIKLVDMTVRHVLNEISLRSGFGWIYEPSDSPLRYVWKVFW